MAHRGTTYQLSHSCSIWEDRFGFSPLKLLILFLSWWSMIENRESADLNRAACNRWLRSFQVQYITACHPRRVRALAGALRGRVDIWRSEETQVRAGVIRHLVATRFQRSKEKGHSQYRWSLDSSQLLQRRQTGGVCKPQLINLSLVGSLLSATSHPWKLCRGMPLEIQIALVQTSAVALPRSNKREDLELGFCSCRWEKPHSISMQWG